jgi:hypothetical protein
MKQIVFYLLLGCILSCYVPPLTHKGTLTEKRMPIPISIYDTTELAIKIVYNPKDSTTYGIQLRNVAKTFDIKIQKISFGDIEKTYPDSCHIVRLDKEEDEFCLIQPSTFSRFAMHLSTKTPFNLKGCKVYYTINHIKKMNYSNCVEIIDCLIGFYPGAAPEPEQLCIWAMGSNK